MTTSRLTAARRLPMFGGALDTEGIDPVEDRPKCSTYWQMGPHPRPCECHGDWCDANWRRGS